MTDETLDNILSGQSEALSAANETEVAQVAEGEGQQEQTDAEGAEGETQGQRMVPQQALHAEKQKVKRYTEEVSDFRRSNEALQRQVAELLQRVPIPKQEEAPKPDWFENPEVAAQHTVHSTVAPQFDRINQTLMAIAKDTAIGRYTEEKVGEAEAAFNRAAQAGAIDPAVHAQINNSPNPWAAAVKWYNAQQAKAEIGDDPAAYRAKLEAEILAKHGLTAEGGAVERQPATVMPSNLAGARNVGSRSGPAWSGPPSLNEIFDTSR